MGSQNRMYQHHDRTGNCVNMTGCRETREMENRGCGKCKVRLGCDSMPIAMAYVPWQEKEDLYPPCKALCEGTAFSELNLIFCGVRG